MCDDRSCREAPRCIKWLIGLGYACDVLANCVIPKLKVNGSNPLSRSNKTAGRDRISPAVGGSEWACDACQSAKLTRVGLFQ